MACLKHSWYICSSGSQITVYIDLQVGYLPHPQAAARSICQTRDAVALKEEVAQ